MFIYLSSFILTIIFSFLYVSKGYARSSKKVLNNGRYNNSFFLRRKTNQTFLFILAAFPFWFISSYRYDVGTDYLFTYVKFFNFTEQGGKPYKEPLFQLLNTVLVRLNLSYTWLFAISAAIIIVSIFYLIFKHSSHPLLSVAVFFCSAIFFNTLNNVRQYIAISISAIAFFQNKNWKSLLSILIATLFHFSALFFLFIFIFSKLHLNKSRFYFLSALSVLMTPLFIFVVVQILKNTQYNYFINYSTGFSLLTVLINIIIYILTLYYYDGNNKKYTMLANIQLITLCLCFCSILMQNEEFWLRLIRMTAFFHIFLIPEIIRRERIKAYKYFLSILILIMFTVYTVYTVVIIGGLEVFPFQFIFNLK